MHWVWGELLVFELCTATADLHCRRQDIVDSLPTPANGGQGEEASPWEGMVRIALMRMMADEEREAAANAACLTKFSELLVLNGVISTEQMWACFNLVGDMYQTSGARRRSH